MVEARESWPPISASKTWLQRWMAPNLTMQDFVSEQDIELVCNGALTC